MKLGLLDNVAAHHQLGEERLALDLLDFVAIQVVPHSIVTQLLQLLVTQWPGIKDIADILAVVEKDLHPRQPRQLPL